MAKIFSTGWESNDLGLIIPEGSYTSRTQVVDNDHILSADPYSAPIEHGNYALKMRGGAYGRLEFSDFGGGPLRKFGIRFRFQTTRSRNQTTILSIMTSTAYADQLMYVNSQGEYWNYIDGGEDFLWMPFESRKWYLFDLFVHISTRNSVSDGSLQLKINGETVIDKQNVATSRSSTENKTVNMIRFWGPATSSDTDIFCLYDDLVIYDDSTAEIVNITDAYTIRGEPTSGGLSNFWLPGGDGTGVVDCVSGIGDTAVVDTSYIVAKGVGGEQTYPLIMDETGITSVESISVLTRARKVGDASAYKSVPLIRNTNGSSEGTPEDLTTSFDSNDYYIWEENSIEGREWEAGDLDTINIGVKADE